MRKVLLLICLSVCWVASSKERRIQQYRPLADAFVCDNGGNRYSRALYGNHTGWRLETSDRPIFAVVDKDCSRNIRLVLETGGKDYPLELVSDCHSSYIYGRRDYTLTNSDWGNAQVKVSVIALPEEDGAILRFSTSLLLGQIKAVACATLQSELQQGVCAGADKPECLEPSGTILQTEVVSLGLQPSYLEVDGWVMKPLDQQTGDNIYKKARLHGITVSDRIIFRTPDPYINTLGSALVLAADGAWDGHTWQHGCIDWQEPLAEQREGCLGDVLGWKDRAISYFDTYIKAQSADVRLDELLWHFQYDADTAYMQKLWPIIKACLARGKRSLDPDGDHLYTANKNLSTVLNYQGGAVTRSSAYFYRANKLVARIAEIIGENARPYREEANAILKAMNERLWLKDKNVWAEYQDATGFLRVHDHPAIWSISTPVDCDACTPEQAFLATGYIEEIIPHVDVEETGYQTIASSDWLPYSWGANNVFPAEVMYMALACFKAGRADEGYRLMKANILDQMYYGTSPGNFGQISYYDTTLGECHRDFGDCIGISSRTLIQGLFGVTPQALDGKCILSPGFPSDWEQASIETPYIKYSYTRKNNVDYYDITQNFTRPLRIIFRQYIGNGKYREIEGSNEKHQIIKVSPVSIVNRRSVSRHPQVDYGLKEPDLTARFVPLSIDRYYNAEVKDIDIFKHATEANDSSSRILVNDGLLKVAGVPFCTSVNGKNIVSASLKGKYPKSVTIPLKGNASSAYLLMAGTTNHMQSQIDNGLVIVTYADNTTDTLALRNPENWCPVGQGTFVENKMLRMILNPKKPLKSLTLKTLSNDVVIGLMAVTLQ